MTTIDLRGGTIRASGTTDAAILTNNHLTSGLGYSGHTVNGGNAVRTTGLICNWAKSNNGDSVTLAISDTTTGIAQSFRTDSSPASSTR